MTRGDDDLLAWYFFSHFLWLSLGITFKVRKLVKWRFSSSLSTDRSDNLATMSKSSKMKLFSPLPWLLPFLKLNSDRRKTFETISIRYPRAVISPFARLQSRWFENKTRFKLWWKFRLDRWLKNFRVRVEKISKTNKKVPKRAPDDLHSRSDHFVGLAGHPCAQVDF